MLDECRNNNDFRKAIGFTIVVWNLCIMPEQEREKAYIELLESLCQNDLEEKTFMSGLIKDYMNRKEKHFNNDKRFVINYEIKFINGDLKLTIAASET
jgi:hypothetical protein